MNMIIHTQLPRECRVRLTCGIGITRIGPVFGKPSESEYDIIQRKRRIRPNFALFFRFGKGSTNDIPLEALGKKSVEIARATCWQLRKIWVRDRDYGESNFVTFLNPG